MNTPRNATNIPMHQRNTRLIWTAKTPRKRDWTRVRLTLALALIVYCAGLVTGLLAMTVIILSN